MKKLLLNYMLPVAFLLFNVQIVSAQEDVSDDELPFTPTTIADGSFASGTTWYKVTIDGGKYWEAKEGEVDCFSGLTDFSDYNYFCFVGNSTDGFKIYNKAIGASTIMYCASSTSHEPLVPTLESSTGTPNTFKLSTNSNGGYNFYYPTDYTACLNDLHGDGVITLWTNTGAPSGIGSCINFEEADDVEPEPEPEEGVPFITTTINNGAFASNTHWYTINIRGSKMLTADATYYNMVRCSTVDEVAKENVWCFTGNKTSGYQVYNYAFGTGYAMYTYGSDDGSLVYLAETPSTWMLSTNASGGYNLYYPGDTNACWNDYNSYVAIWNNVQSPGESGSCLVFTEFDVKKFNGGGEEEKEDTTVTTPTLVPVSGPVRYIYFNQSGYVDAYPENYISETRDNGKTFTIIDKNGREYEYAYSDVKVSDQAPTNQPSITSFKFNNKFNDMLMTDADGEIVGDSAINISVGGIGKRLIPSFQLSSKSALVYIDGKKQISKETSQRFEKPLTYTVCNPGYKMLRMYSDSTFERMPFGREYKVTVDYLCDHPTTECGVPVIYITTNDGQIISSKETYKAGTIKIDGAGYFPDMAVTDMNIKGRGNSSWSTPETRGWYVNDPKNPYHVKFDTKQKPLGMKAGKHWNLIAQKQTGSMTSNPVATRLTEMMKTDGANHFIPVELYINDEYRGSYCLTEKVGFSNNSIDLDDEKNATLLELDSYSSDFTTTAMFPSQGLPVTIHYPDFSDASDTTNLTFTDIKNSFNAFTTAVSTGTDITKYVDIPSTARFLMVNDMIVNYEILHPKSTYCYCENILADSLYHFGPTWDFDWAFGYEDATTYFENDWKVNFYTDASSNLERKQYIYKLRYSTGEAMDREYYRVWTDFVNNHLDDLCEYCQDYYNVAAKSLSHDNDKWYTGSNYEKITANSIAWLRKRAAYVYDYLSNTLGYADKDYLDPDPEVIPDPDVIETATADRPAVQGIFDMQGRRIGTDLQSLPKGLYIINGKKVFKR